MEDPWPSAPWLLPFLCTFDVCLFTTGSDCPLVIAGVDFLSKQGDDVRDPGWDLANFEICWKAAAAHPTFFQLIFKCVFFSLWNRTVSLTTAFDVETSTFGVLSVFYQLRTNLYTCFCQNHILKQISTNYIIHTFPFIVLSSMVSPVFQYLVDPPGVEDVSSPRWCGASTNGECW